MNRLRCSVEPMVHQRTRLIGLHVSDELSDRLLDFAYR
jgi:hypothetical protein